MAEPVKTLHGWEDILAAPEDLTAEVLGGELITSPRPHPRHGRVQAVMSAELSGPFDVGRGGPGGWWILIEPDVAFGAHDIVAPDLVGWRRKRMPAFPDEQPIFARPDWICEVLSPRTAGRDRTAKADLYLRAGVPHYWLVDPQARTLEAFEREDDRWARLGAWSDGDDAAIPPFDAIEIPVGDLFPPEPEEGQVESR
ncbi:MAG: Uma2 family endonuclease [Acidobacteriota bacterium]|jgi:Uma2 family endonuclease